MKLTDFAHSLAIKVNREEDFGYIESLKFDILGYRASIIASLDDRSISEQYYQQLSNFNILEDDKVKSIKIPKLLTFKDGSFKLVVSLRYKNTFKSVTVLTEERAEFIDGRRFSNKQPFIILSNDTLYTKNFDISLINNLVISGIFNNPTELVSFAKNNKCQQKSSCLIDGELDIEDSLYQKIVIFVYKQLGIENQNQILTTDN